MLFHILRKQTVVPKVVLSRAESGFHSWMPIIAFVVIIFMLIPPAQAQALNPPAISPTTSSSTTQSIVAITASAGTIYYTVDGSIPNTSSTPYTAPFVIGNPTQINAIAYSSGIYSTVTTVYLDVDPALAPILQTGLILRLRGGLGIATTFGSPALVTQWTDLTGNPNSFFATGGSQPIFRNFKINHLPVVNFSGTSQYLYSQGQFVAFTSGITIFMVTQPTALSAGMRMLDLGDATSGNNILFQVSSTGSYAQFWTYSGTSGSAAQSASPLTQNQYQLLEAVQSGNTATFYLNGVPGTANASMPSIPSTIRFANFLGQASAGGNYYSGNIAEVLLYNQALTNTQRVAIEAYLMQKYQLLLVNPTPPSISVPTGTLNGPTQVVIASQSGTVTYITTDGTTPTISSPVYSGSPINITYTQTLKAISVKNGLMSSVATATYTLNSSQWPAPNPSDITAPTINLQLPAPTL